MNNKNKKLERRRLFLCNRIQDIKNCQNELMLKNILLSSIREDLESKRATIERLIVNSNKPVIPKQIISRKLNNIALPRELFMN